MSSKGIALGRQWELWPDFVLRSAGFPVRRVEALRAPGLATIADELLALEQRVRSGLLGKLSGERSDSRARRKARAMLRRADHDLWAIVRKLSNEADLDFLAAQHAEAEALQQRLKVAFEEAARSLHEELGRQALEPSLREAITWQNYRAFDVIRRNLHARAKKARQAGDALSKYLQRYCTKNDTAGFFGPFQWALIDPDIESISLELGPNLTARCRAYLEHWAVEAMAELAIAVPGVRRALAPRIAPLYSLRDDALWSPMGMVRLSENSATVLAAIDGERSAELIAALLVAQGTVENERGVFEVLEHGATQGWIIWGRDVPTDAGPYERHFREQLAEVSDDDLRARALAPLQRLEDGRDAALAARGDPDAVEAALKDLDARFEALTRRRPTRRAGQAYAARTLTFLQCTRDVKLELGQAFVTALRPLTLVLDSLRWLSFQLAHVYRDEVGGVYRKLCDQLGGADVPLLPLVTEMAPIMETLPERTGVLSEFERKWEELLGAGDSNIELGFETLAPRVVEAFAVEGAGFPNGRVHSPDVLIAATSPEAIARHDFFVVLGEIHPYGVTLESENFLAEHPDRPRLEAALREAFPDGRPAAAQQRGHALRTAMIPLGRHPMDLHIETPNSRSSWPSERRLAAGEIIIREEGGELMLVERDGDRRWNALHLLFVIPRVSFFDSRRAHSPRVTIDRFVLSRERWCFRADELPFLSLKDPLERFVAVRRWARTHGIPRLTFCKVPSEPKPLYLDLDAPHYVAIFCKACQAQDGDSPLSITEMLPLPEQCWLPDAKGNHYTSELRLVAMDLRAPADVVQKSLE